MFLGFADHFQRKKQEFFLGMTSVCDSLDRKVDRRKSSRKCSGKQNQLEMVQADVNFKDHIYIQW